MIISAEQATLLTDNAINNIRRAVHRYLDTHADDISEQIEYAALRGDNTTRIRINVQEDIHNSIDYDKHDIVGEILTQYFNSIGYVSKYEKGIVSFEHICIILQWPKEKDSNASVAPISNSLS